MTDPRVLIEDDTPQPHALYDDAGCGVDCRHTANGDVAVSVEGQVIAVIARDDWNAAKGPYGRGRLVMLAWSIHSGAYAEGHKDGQTAARKAMRLALGLENGEAECAF